MSDKLSEHFSRSEFACHGTNCCGGSAPIDAELIDALELLRALVSVALYINCGFRCLTHNRTLGSQDDSQHPLGLAADVAVPEGFTVEQFAEMAEQVPAFADGGIGRYPTRGFIHVDCRHDGPSRWTA